MAKQKMAYLIEGISSLLILYLVSYYILMVLKIDQTLWEKLYDPVLNMAEIISGPNSEMGVLGVMIMLPLVLIGIIFIFAQLVFYLLYKKFSKKLIVICLVIFGPIFLLIAFPFLIPFLFASGLF